MAPAQSKQLDTAAETGPSAWQAFALGALVACGVSFVIYRLTSAQRTKPPRRPKKDTQANSHAKEPLTIIHFNDVYEVVSREKEPVGGAARFGHLVKRLNQEYAQGKALILFSGDALNPSLLSQRTMGRHMVEVLNEIGVRFSALGNHDLDFGEHHFATMRKDCKFEWFLANVLNKQTKEPLGGCTTHRIIDWNGHKIGLMGIAEPDWLETAHIDLSNFIVQDPTLVARTLARKLRSEGADIVIALTHMREPNDMKLACEAPELDFVLGGHDHQYVSATATHTTFSGLQHHTHVVKSGTDFRTLSLIKAEWQDDGQLKVDVKKFECRGEEAQDETLKAIVDSYCQNTERLGDVVIGHMPFDLDCRFETLRTKESLIGNLIATVMLRSVSGDAAILNSGALRANQVIPKGPFLCKHLSALFPTMIPLTVVEINGSQLLEALEIGVSEYPLGEGRFPLISGIRFRFHARKPPHSRVDPNSVFVGSQALDKTQSYKIVTTTSLASGKDGYDVFSQGRVLLDIENAPVLSTILRNHIAMSFAVNAFEDSAQDTAKRFARRWRDPGTCKIDGRITCIQD